jgi:hypothetical protein
MSEDGRKLSRGGSHVPRKLRAQCRRDSRGEPRHSEVRFAGAQACSGAATTRTTRLSDQTAPVADRDSVGAGAGLKLGKQVAHVGFHRLLREEEAGADLSVDEALRDQLEDFELTRGRLLLELLERRAKRDDFTAARRGPPLSVGLETPGMVHVATEDRVTLTSVHASNIGFLREFPPPPF